MKKIMTALAGVLTVMLLASCQKEVEIDGDVSFEKDSSQYLYDVKCTATQKYDVVENELEGFKYQGESSDSKMCADIAIIKWNKLNSNQTAYNMTLEYTGKLDESKGEEALGFGELIEYKGEYYLDQIRDEKKVTVKGSPRDSKFTISSDGTFVGWDNNDNPQGRRHRGRYVMTLEFTRR